MSQLLRESIDALASQGGGSLLVKSNIALLKSREEGTTGDGSTVMPFHSNLFQSAIAADVPVQPLGLRFEDVGTGSLSFIPCYVGEESLLQSVWRTVCAQPQRAVLAFGPPQTSQGRDRRQFAAALRESVLALRAGTG